MSIKFRSERAIGYLIEIEDWLDMYFSENDILDWKRAYEQARETQAVKMSADTALKKIGLYEKWVKAESKLI